MAPPGVCPQCGLRLPADAPHGVCPKCLLGLGFDQPTSRSEHGLQPTAAPGQRFIPPTPAELAPHFPHLEILELIGQGGMGAVYRARQKSLDRVVALKVLPPEVGNDPAFAERFGREARALGSLTHPNIVMVFDFGHVNGYYFFVMEYVDGVNLRQSLQTARLTPEQALTIVPQVCEALQYAHDQGIVHRDIKPENVLLDRKGRVKIADFGLAKLLGRGFGHLSLTGTGQVMGTPHYMAPEQMEKPMQVDHRADIYSLGVVFYELLTGELPLGRFAPPSEKSNVSADLDQVVLRTLEKEPGRRYQHASEVKTAVESIAHDPRATARTAAPAGGPRLRIPFTIGDIYGGLARADGILRFDGQALDLEYQVKDDLFGCVSSDVKHIVIPLQDVLALNLVPGLLGWRTYLELRTDRLHTLGDVPGKKGGVVRLTIARTDVESARALSHAVQSALGHTAEPAFAGQSLAKPPLPGTQPNRQRIAADVRAPAIGLTVVGILDCLVVLVLGLLVPAFTLGHTVQTEVPRANPPQVTMFDGSSPNQGTVAVVPQEQPVVTQAIGPRLLLVLLPVMAVVLAFPIVIIVGAMRMQQMKSYGLAMTAAVIAVLPFYPLFILGFPFGLWALIVLMRRETRDAFHASELSAAGLVGGPYDSDLAAAAIPPKPGAPTVHEPTKSLRGASLSLMLLGIASALCCIVGCVLAVQELPSPEWALVTSVLPILAGLLQLKAGVRMRQMRGRAICLVGATLALLPIGSVWAFTQLPTNRVPPFPAISLTLIWLCGIVIGAWAWYALSRPDNRWLFNHVGTDSGLSQPPLPYRSDTPSYAFIVPLIIVMCFSLLLIVVVFGMVFWTRTSSTVEYRSWDSLHTNPVVEPLLPDAPPMPEPPEAPVPAEAPDPPIPK